MRPLGRWAAPLSRLYGAVVEAKNAQFDSGTRPARRLQGPVVSVGNVSAGGTGKTPFVMLLAGLLHARGIAVDVLSRGYRRKTRGVFAVHPKGTVAEFGDEPLLMAQRLSSLGIPVIVGEDRLAAGQFAESQYGVRLHLLDDGFQHRQLARDFDIVLVREGDAQERLLPAGRLREPLTALARADTVVGDATTDFTRFPAIPKWVWQTKRALVLEPVNSTNASAEEPALALLQPVAFCGVARPNAFFQQIHGLGMRPVAERAFADHHRYAASDVAELKRLANAADGFVTTEKDLVNLGKLAAELHPLWVARLQVELLLADECVEQLLRTLTERGRRVPVAGHL